MTDEVFGERQRSVLLELDRRRKVQQLPADEWLALWERAQAAETLAQLEAVEKAITEKS
jgi:hypothetical protein